MDLLCSDIDIICSWFAPARPTRISSFGSLQHFKKSGKPALAGNATRCLDCAYEKRCPYSAKKSKHKSSPACVPIYPSCFKPVYLDRVTNGHREWPLTPLVDGVPDIENITEALKTGPYGKCVYESDNDVVDHQACLLHQHQHLYSSNLISNNTIYRSSTLNSPRVQRARSPWSHSRLSSASARRACISRMVKLSET